MAEGRNALLGILAIILGILVMAFPLIGVFAASALAGVGILFLGIWLFAQSFESWESSKGISILLLLLGLIAIILGIGLFGNILAFSIFVSLWFYIGGLFLIISGIFSLFGGNTAAKGVGGLGIVLGILYMILAMYAWDPFYLALLIGIWLIITGVFQLLAPAAPAEVAE
jgi:uncharacterized membrane protein HdeD (DUF308 family)